MSFFVRQATARIRAFPRTVTIAAFVVVSSVAQVQTLVNLHP